MTPRVWSMALVSALLGCDTVAMDFGDVATGAVANVYFQQVTPTRAPAALAPDSEATTAQATLTHGSFCTVIHTDTPNQEFGTVKTHGQPLVRTTGDSLVLNVEDEDGLMTEHRFEQTFFESRQVTTFTATLANGNAYAYAVWGADACETCPPGVPAGTDACFPAADAPVPANPPVPEASPPAVVVE